MATEKILKARIVHKHDVQSNWEKATSFTPKEGELIVYEADESVDFPRLKVGDGTSNVNDLPFVISEITIEEIDGLCGEDTVTT